MDVSSSQCVWYTSLLTTGRRDGLLDVLNWLDRRSRFAASAVHLLPNFHSTCYGNVKASTTRNM